MRDLSENTRELITGRENMAYYYARKMTREEYFISFSMSLRYVVEYSNFLGVSIIPVDGDLWEIAVLSYRPDGYYTGKSELIFGTPVHEQFRSSLTEEGLISNLTEDEVLAVCRAVMSLPITEAITMSIGNR